MREPTRQQKHLVHEYLKLRKKKSGKQAAINAGYSPKTAQSQASQILALPHVQEYMKSQEALIAQELQQEFVMDALEAREVMYNIMKSKESRDADRIAVAKDFLDRAGFKPTEKMDIDTQGEIIVKFSIPRPKGK